MLFNKVWEQIMLKGAQTIHDNFQEINLHFKHIPVNVLQKVGEGQGAVAQVSEE